MLFCIYLKVYTRYLKENSATWADNTFYKNHRLTKIPVWAMRVLLLKVGQVSLSDSHNNIDY